MADIATQVLTPASGGEDQDSAPEYLARDKAPWVENLLTDRPNILTMRGPLYDGAAWYTGTAFPKVCGVWAHGDFVLLGMRANSATAKREPHVAPYRKAAAEADLADASTTELVRINLDGNVRDSITTSLTADKVPAGRGARIGPNVYGFSYDSVAAGVSQNGGYLKLRPFIRWDGTAAVPVVYTNGPRGGFDVKAHYNRLFVLGGRNPDGTGNIQFSTLYFTDAFSPDAALTDAVASWQDDTSGLVNKIVVDSEDPNDFGVALAKVGQSLVIFKRHSVHLLQGYSPSTFVLRPVSNEVGCLDPRSVVEYAGGVFFMSERGFMFFDGVDIVPVSTPETSSLVASALERVGDAGVDGGAVWAGPLPNGYIGVAVSDLTFDANTKSTVYFCGLYHARTGAWSQFSSDALGTAAKKPIAFETGAHRTFLLDDKLLLKTAAVTLPESVSDDKRGIDLDVSVVFTIDNSTTFTGAGNTLKNSLAQEAWTGSAAGAQFPIPAKWYSRLLRLATPSLMSQLHRVLFDYRFKVAGAFDDQYGGWYVTLLDGEGVTVVPEYQVPAQGEPSSFLYRRRHVKGAKRETEDVQVRVTWKGTALGLAAADILDTTVEYQPTRQRG